MSAKSSRPKSWYTGRAAVDDAGPPPPVAVPRAPQDPDRRPQAAVRPVPLPSASQDAAPAPAPEPLRGAQVGIPSEVEQLIEHVGARYVADLRALSEAFARFYAAQMSAKDKQIATLSQSLAAAQRERGELSARLEALQGTFQEHDAVSARFHDSEVIRQERDALAARLQELEQTRFQIMRTIARELGTVSLTPARPGLPAPTRADGPRDASSGPIAQLEIEGRAGDGRAGRTTVVLHSNAVVGRWPGSDIQISDSFISSDHARLTLREGRWWVLDLGSTNGTFVNGARIAQPTELSDGDEVRFGRVRTRFTGQTHSALGREPTPVADAARPAVR